MVHPHSKSNDDLSSVCCLCPFMYDHSTFICLGQPPFSNQPKIFYQKVFIDCVYKPCEFLVRAENAFTIRHVLNRIFNHKSRLNSYLGLSRLYCIAGYITARPWWEKGFSYNSNAKKQFQYYIDEPKYLACFYS